VGWEFVKELYITSGCKNLFLVIFLQLKEVYIDAVIACFCSLLFGKVQL
jgi:hypothetical protein